MNPFHCVARVQNIVDQQDVPVRSVGFEGTKNPGSGFRVSRVAVARYPHAVEPQGNAEVADQVGGKDDGSVEESHDKDFLALVMTVDFESQFGNALANVLLAQKDLFNVVFQER